jgi:hypothetical protein
MVATQGTAEAAAERPARLDVGRSRVWMRKYFAAWHA